MTATLTPYHSQQRRKQATFARLLWAEWTKFWTVRSWLVTVAAAVILTVLATVALAATANGKTNPAAHPAGPVGPGGEKVTDIFYFVHRPLGPSGSITARVASLTDAESPGNSAGYGPAPWGKAGLIIKAGTKPGSAYAAIMATPGHGVRMQYDFIHDVGGLPGAVSAASPRWLRLTRAGDTITGYDSADGRHWQKVATAHLAGLPATAQAGLFATSPPDIAQSAQSFGFVDTHARAVFGHVSLVGDWTGGRWRSGPVGTITGPVSSCHGFRCHIKPGRMPVGSAAMSAGTVTLTGTGDIAPYVSQVDPLWVAFKGSLLGLITLTALGVVFVTAEYRRGLIGTTFAASPRRGRVLVAKAVVIGAVSFLAGLVSAAVAFPIAEHKIAANGWVTSVYPVVSLLSGTGLRIVIGTGALLAATAVLALAAGTMFRRTASAITAVIALIIVPVVLTIVLTGTAGQWLVRLTPAAAFGLQQGVPMYPQVISACQVRLGCDPLPPWAGFGVLCGYAVLALGAAVYLVRRRDA